MGRGIKKKRLLISLKHAFYVGGLTFFSYLTAQFINELPSQNLITIALYTATLSSGFAFFTSMAAQRNYTNRSNGNGKSAKPCTTDAQDSPSFLERLLDTAHVARISLNRIIFASTPSVMEHVGA